MATGIQRWAHGALCALICISIVSGLGGCMKQRRKGPNMVARMQDAPPIMVDDSGEVYIIVMRAPNPGWSFSYEMNEKTADGVDVFVTIRRPDPSMLYPMVIVEKQLSTPVRTDVEMRLLARLLGHDETTNKRRYAPVGPVGSFAE
ncbi:MAG: hypothetical protein JKY96_00330 [Phycisphaerales bacterium]|nr:hypothetical protein [Phycisphaerales bacterium]